MEEAKMTTPTREYVERMIKCSPFAFDNEAVRADWVDVLKAYLAQAQELAQKDEDLADYKEMLDKVLDEADKLEADNQALRDRIAEPQKLFNQAESEDW